MAGNRRQVAVGAGETPVRGAQAGVAQAVSS